MLAAQHGAAQVHLHDAIPIVGVHLGHGTLPLDAGVVHQDVDLAEVIEHAPHQPRDARLLGDVGGYRQDAASRRLDLRRRVVQLALRAARDGDVRAGARQRVGHRPPEPLAAAGDQRHLPRQIEPAHDSSAKVSPTP